LYSGAGRYTIGAPMRLNRFGFSVVPTVVKRLYSRWVSRTYPFAAVGEGLSVHPTCNLLRHTAHRMRLGNCVVFEKDAWVYVATDDTRTEPVLIIDDNCFIARQCQLAAKNCIHLEAGVILSSSVLITDHLHAYEDVTRHVREQGQTEGGTILIKEGCWIGHGAAIVCDKGEIVLGPNSVVAANAVVTRSFPPFSVIAGNPARVVRHYDFKKAEWVVGGPHHSLESDREHQFA
jgi:acetyltransferase-like isoleucine patch superfamily enzyme